MRSEYLMGSRLLCFFGNLKVFNTVTASKLCQVSRYSATYNSNSFEKLMVDFKKHLRTAGIAYKEGYTCLQTQCRICDLTCGTYAAFINKTTGQFMCPHCDKKLPLSEVTTMYEKGIYLSASPVEYMSRAISLSNVPKEIHKLLKVPLLKAADLNSLGVKYDKKLKTLHFPLRNAVEKIVGERVLNCESYLEEGIPKENCSGLIIYEQHHRKAILVSNILDFLSILSQKIEGYSIICLPNFSMTLPHECLPGLEMFKQLILWLHCEAKERKSPTDISKSFDSKRCLIIRSTENQPGAYTALKNGLNLKVIVQTAHPVTHKSIVSFSALKEDVFGELQNKDKVNGVKWERFPVLNKILKGHRKGELTILTGPTGCGKTTFMSEYSLDLALQGVSTLWGSFEIRNTRLATTLLRQFVGYSLADKLDEFEFWATKLEKYPLYFMTFHGQETIKNVMETIEHARYVNDISHVIIDNVQFMIGVSPVNKNDKFWEQDLVIATFRKFATEKNVHVTLVMHPRKERETEELTVNSILGSAKATQEADNVLIIQGKRLSSITGKKVLQIAKNRFSGDLGIMSLDFNKEGLSYGKTKKNQQNADIKKQ